MFLGYCALHSLLGFDDHHIWQRDSALFQPASAESLWKSFNLVSTFCNPNQWHPRNLAQPATQLGIVGADQIDAMLHGPLYDTVIGVGTRVLAPESLVPFIPGRPESQAVSRAQLFQLGKNAVGDDGDALGQEQVHQAGFDVDFGADGMGEEVGVEQDLIGRFQAGIRVEEQT